MKLWRAISATVMLGLILNIIISQEEELDVHVVVPDPFSASFMYFMYLKKGEREGNSQYVKIHIRGSISFSQLSSHKLTLNQQTRPRSPS